MNSTPTLSVIIIAKNEAACIRQCLESVRALATEIIVLDSGSTDDTVAICREFTPHVYITDWPGYGIQKNRGLSYARSEWILSLDADEWLSEGLQAEIGHVLQDTEQDAFYIPILTQYCGQWLHHGDAGRDAVIRLFRRHVGRFSDNIVHESVQLETRQIGRLRHRLYHNSYKNLEELIERMNHYSSLTASMRYAKGRRSSLGRAILGGLWTFIQGYFLRLGFLDGKIGFIVAVSNAESSYYRHLKLAQMECNPSGSSSK